MNKIAALLIRFVIPLATLYLAFTYLGTAGGIILTAIYLVIMNLSMIFNNLATRAYRSGDHEKALKRLETALKLGPKTTVSGSLCMAAVEAWTYRRGRCSDKSDSLRSS